MLFVLMMSKHIISTKSNLMSSALVRPCISGFVLTASANGSVARANRSGEKGQPCLIPLLSA